MLLISPSTVQLQRNISKSCFGFLDFAKRNGLNPFSESIQNNLFEAITSTQAGFQRMWHALLTIEPLNNDIMWGKALKFVSCVLNELCQTANIESRLTIYIGTKGVNNLEMSSVSNYLRYVMKRDGFHSAFPRITLSKARLVQSWKPLEFDCLSWKVLELWQTSLKSAWISK